MTWPDRVHIIGRGGRHAAAVTLIADGHPVALYEASQHAGGRCRSFLDSELGCRIDSSNHLLLAGNTAALAYIERISAFGTFSGQPRRRPVRRLPSGERWGTANRGLCVGGSWTRRAACRTPGPAIIWKS
jgi:phytoene dehydrogenase-like protein